MGRQKFITLYSDGGSVNNGGKEKDKPIYGAYCALIVNNDNIVQKKFVKVFQDVTNNQMEVLGPLTAMLYLEKYYLKKLKPKKLGLKVKVVSDSQYFIKGCNEWMKGWKKRGWKNNEKKTISNIDLWKEVDNLLNRNPGLEFEFIWISGHEGKKIKLEDNKDVYFNEMCDSILSEELAPYR